MKNPFRKIGIFFGETANELKLATWPTAKEMRRYVSIVLIGMALLGVYVAIVNFGLMQAVDLISSWVRGTLGS